MVTPHPGLRAFAAVADRLLRIAVGRGLEPLPGPEASVETGARAVAGPAELWQLLASLPRDQAASGPLRSTLRVASGDLRQKVLDQRPKAAGDGSPPAGFERLADVAGDEGGLPLCALARAPRDGRPILFVLHGLFDSKMSAYVRVVAELLARFGYGVVCPDLRWHGCHLAGGSLTTLGLEEAEDVRRWARWVRGRYPDHDLGLVGFSLGALTTIHALAADDESLFAAGGVAIAPPGDLGRILESLERTDWYRGFAGAVAAGFRFTLRWRDERLDLDRRRPISDALRLVARQHGDHSPEAFLAAADPRGALARVRRPLLLLSTLDDPVFPGPTAAEISAAAAPLPWVEHLVSPEGGHLGQLILYPRWIAALLLGFFARSPEI